MAGPGLPSPLLSLSDELLEAILLHLPCKERAQTALVCRRLAELSRSSQMLWRKVSVSGAGDGPLAHILPFLAPRAVAVQTLQLHWDEHADEEEAVVPTTTALVGAVALCAPTLRTLCIELRTAHNRLSVYDNLRVGQWAAMLRQLEWLVLEWDALTLSSHLGTLPRLKGLALVASLVACNFGFITATLQPGCLPRSLRYLWADNCRFATWPAALHALTGLQMLQWCTCKLAEPASGPGWEQLAALQQLSHLELAYTWLEEGLPSELTALSRLAVLDVQATGFGVPHEQALQPLAELRGITDLGLSSLELERLPPVLAEMPGLRVLHIRENPNLLLDDSCAAVVLPRLTALACDMPGALQVTHMLPDCTRLARLALHSSQLYSVMHAVFLSAPFLLMPALAAVYYAYSGCASLAPTWKEGMALHEAWLDRLRAALQARPGIAVLEGHLPNDTDPPVTRQGRGPNVVDPTSGVDFWFR